MSRKTLRNAPLMTSVWKIHEMTASQWTYPITKKRTITTITMVHQSFGKSPHCIASLAWGLGMIKISRCKNIHCWNGVILLPTSTALSSNMSSKRRGNGMFPQIKVQNCVNRLSTYMHYISCITAHSKYIRALTHLWPGTYDLGASLISLFTCLN